MINTDNWIAATRIALSVSLSCVAFAASADDLPESSDRIKLSINEWTGQHITTKVAGNILQRMGYNVEYVTAGYVPQFTALSDGSLDVALEIWLSNIGETWPKARETGNVVEIGSLGLEAKEGWVYPAHMTEFCPGLPDWRGLLEAECIQALASADTLPDGRILDYPSDWGQHSIRIINGLELDFRPISAGSEGALVSELKAATLKKSPAVAMFWSPHWLFNEIELNWVELPAFGAVCIQ
ncbi:glycine betaine ABC transporter substrate-binding protein [Yoonia sp.]|uniref:glycine betaine ABC transporter substrate-binding protein n=1 Tax=Yoonia sp. TaxID=2212373 RepID=UPI00391AEC8D